MGPPQPAVLKLGDCCCCWSGWVSEEGVHRTSSAVKKNKKKAPRENELRNSLCTKSVILSRVSPFPFYSSTNARGHSEYSTLSHGYISRYRKAALEASMLSFILPQREGLGAGLKAVTDSQSSPLPSAEPALEVTSANRHDSESGKLAKSKMS